jgi:two-component system alkaline phosphatase synthesis response regulator PhoP
VPIKILLVEADPTLASLLESSLAKRGYEISVTNGSEAALEQVRTNLPDLVIFDDVSFPLDGRLTCEVLQRAARGISVLIISETPLGKIDRGWIDEHLPHPFTTKQLLSKIKQLERVQRGRFLRQSGITLDVLCRRVFRSDRVADLTPKECRLLQQFMRNSGKVLSRRTLMKEVWDTDYLGDTRTLDVHVRWIREKIEDNPSEPLYLRTVRGVGYRFEVPESAAEEDSE